MQYIGYLVELLIFGVSPGFVVSSYYFNIDRTKKSHTTIASLLKKHSRESRHIRKKYEKLKFYSVLSSIWFLHLLTFQQLIACLYGIAIKI